MKQGWEIKKLGEVCEISTGNANTEDAIENGEFAFFDRSKIIKRSSSYLFDCEAIIIAGEGATFLPKFYSGKFNLHQRAYAIFNFNKNVDIQYAYKYLIHFHKYFEQVAVGATVKSLRLRHFQELPIPLPPLPEQQSIVAILDEAFSVIAKAKANAEQNLKNARELFESVLNGELSMVEGKLREGWEEKTLAQISETFGRGKSKHRPRNFKGLYGGDYPFIQTGDIRNCDHYVTEYTQTYNEMGLAQSKLWKKGTICITIAANIAETGVLAFDACFPDSVIGLVVNEKIADRDFVEYLLQFFKTRLQALGKGSAQANLNMGTFENELFPIPPLKQQQIIVQKLDELSLETKKLEIIYQQKINDLEELKKSVLQKAFSGELTSKSVEV